MLRLPKILRRLAALSQRAYAGASGSDRWRDDPRAAAPLADTTRGSQIVGQRVAGLNQSDAAMRSLVTTIVSNLIGSGVVLNTLDDERDNEFNRFRFDQARRVSLSGLQRQWAHSWAVHGEAIGLHLVLEDEYAFQILHPDQLDRSKNEDRDASGAIVSGVEFDADWRIVAYWITPYPPGWPHMTNNEPRRYVAADVVHAFLPETPGQVRGVSPIAAALPMVNTSSDMIDALLMNMKTSALVAGIIRSPDNTQVFPDAKDPTLEPGSLIRLRPGEDFSPLDPNKAGDGPAVLKAVLRLIAASCGVTYEDVAGDLEGTTYSSFRGGALTARRKSDALRKLLVIEGLLDPLYRRWQAVELLTGRTSAAIEPDWIEPAGPIIDPAKEVKADIEAIKAGIKSRREVVEARGREFEKVNKEIAEDGFQSADADAA